MSGHEKQKASQDRPSLNKTSDISSKLYLKIKFLPHRIHNASPLKRIDRIMLYREIIAVYSEVHVKHK
jgi:hypothetical protein